MASETLTEDLTRDVLTELGYFDPAANLRVERKQTAISSIKRLLVGASKTGGEGAGFPDFIITSDLKTDYVIVIECKASLSKHESSNRDRIADFAVDGVLHYSKFLAKEFNVIAIAISGESRDQFKVSTFIQSRRTSDPSELKAISRMELDHLLPFDDYIRSAEYSPEMEHLRESELLAFSRELHDFLWKYAKLTEEQKPLLVSGTLIALMDPAFANGYSDFTASKLQKRWGEVVLEQIEAADIPHSKKINIFQPYSGIAVHPSLSQGTKDFPKGVLNEVLRRIKENVWPYITLYRAHDIVGKFYGEFLKYTGGDKKALGIVLTPRHITELFALLANVSPTDRVLDPCAGTGGFLISAMDKMLRQTTSEKQKDAVKAKNLIGIEDLPHMYALAASNMIFRGDGKANLYQGDCFKPEFVAEITARRPNIGMVNPPYSQGNTKDNSELHELAFVDNMLGMLTKGGLGIAIVPISCATSPNLYKKVLLKKHTLEAVMSMPIDLFNKVGVVTCVMVFTAKVPHQESNKETWFGYWRDDGFVKTKHLGRVDLDGKWADIRDHWVDSFRNRKVIPGQSVSCKVSADDEWVAEAYMETDYDALTAMDFEKVLRNYAIFQLMNEDSLAMDVIEG